MTPAQLQTFLDRHPRLFHMTAEGAWESIRRHGLLSTTALLDRAGLSGDARRRIEHDRRETTIPVPLGDGSVAYVRDQSPMRDDRLRRALPPDVSPSDWRRRLNGLVFFWVSETRMLNLSKARLSRGVAHDVLVLDTRRLVENLHDAIRLCPINSGATLFTPVPRGPETFGRIDAYDYADWVRKRGRAGAVVEFCVEYAIPDIAPYLIERRRVRDGVYAAPP